MKKVFEKCIYCVITALMLFITSGAQAATVTLGYCNNEIKDTDYRNDIQFDAPVQGAIRFTSAQLSAYKGAKITKLRIGAEAGMTKTYLWVRPSLSQPAVAIKRLGTTADGWNEVILDSPYTITGDEIYIGFNGTMPQGNHIIMNGMTNSNGAFVAIDNQWEDFSTENAGSLLIQAIVETEGEMATADLGLESIQADSKFAKNGEKRNFMATIGNYGNETVKVPTLHFQIGNMPEQTYTEENEIKAGSNITVNFSSEINNLPEGKNTMKVWIDDPEGSTDNNSLETELYAYTTSYPRKILLEQFTTINCTNCPAGNRTLNKNFGSKDNVVWVAHHVGFGEDELTADASRDIMNLGVTSAPLAMLDRTMLAISENGTPTFGIGYSNESIGAQFMSIAYAQANLQPSFVSVNINAEYNEQTRELKAIVSGEKNDDLYSLLYDKTNLTVYLTEDNVKAETVQTGGGANDYYHNHVLREALTEAFGDELTWNGNSYTASFTKTLPANWKSEDMKIIAFVNHPYNGNPQNAEVLNTNSVSLSTLTAINGTANADGKATYRYFTLQGMPVNEADLQPNSVYIERITTANGTQSRKVVME